MARRTLVTMGSLFLLLGLAAGCATPAAGVTPTPRVTPTFGAAPSGGFVPPVGLPPVSPAPGLVRTPIPSAPMPGLATTTTSSEAVATLAVAPTVAPPTTPLPAASPVTPAPGNVGYLEGSVNVGPLRPVQRVGEPTPTPSPEVCTSRGLTVYQQDGNTEVTSLSFEPDCTYLVALTPGTYVVKVRPASGVGGSKDLPRTVTIANGQTVRLDINFDTGIR